MDRYVSVLCRTEKGLLLPNKIFQVLQDVMEEGQKKHGGKWKDRDEYYYTNRAWDHIRKLFLKQNDEDHLAHAMTDLALAIALRGKDE